MQKVADDLSVRRMGSQKARIISSFAGVALVQLHVTGIPLWSYRTRESKFGSKA